MRKILLYLFIAIFILSCDRLDIDNPKQTQSITQIRAKISDRKTRVALDIDNTFVADNTYWKAGDFLFVAELSQDGKQFTGHILKYDYVLPDPVVDEALGVFNGIGMVTGGRYLVVNTAIPYIFIGLPHIGDSFFECTFKSNFVCTASFGDKLTEVQNFADELLFLGTVSILDDDTDVAIALTSPMSMVELRLTTNVDMGAAVVAKVTVQSEDDVFSYKIYADETGNCQSAALTYNYHWTKLNSLVQFTTDHYQSLSATTPLKVRILAFQKENTTTKFTITATMNDGSTLTYTTPAQTQPLTPNAVTVIEAKLE